MTGLFDSQGDWTTFAERWLTAFESPNTRDAYRRDLDAFARWCQQRGAAVLTADDALLAGYREWCFSEGTSPTTLGRRLSSLASFYRAVAAATGTEPPRIERPTEPAVRDEAPRSLTDDEIASLELAAAALGLRTSLLVGLLLIEKLRVGEAVALDAGDVDVSGSRVWLRVARPRRTEPILLNRLTAATAASYLDGRRDGPLLMGESPTRPRGGRLTRFGADYLIKEAARGAGLGGGVSASTLRRTPYRSSASRTRPHAPGPVASNAPDQKG